MPLHPSIGKLFILQILITNLLTSPGRTFGKGGLLSTVWETVFHACDRVGSVNIASGEWLNALHEDQPAEHCSAILWSLIFLAFNDVVFVQVLFTELWVSPVISSAIWLAYLLGLPQHFGLQENVADFCKSVWSMTVNPVFEFLYWQLNFTCMRLFCLINLKKLHQAVKDDMLATRSLIGARREMLQAW